MAGAGNTRCSFLVGAAALVVLTAEAWVLPPASRTALPTVPRARGLGVRRGSGALRAAADPVFLEHAASALNSALNLLFLPHGADTTAASPFLYLADADLALPDASELLKAMPRADEFMDAMPKLPAAPDLPSQLQDALKSAPGALDSLKGFAQGLKSNLGGLKDGASSLAESAGKVSLPSLPELPELPKLELKGLDLKGLDLKDLDLSKAPLPDDLKAKLAEIQGSVGGAVGSKLSELGGAVGEQVGKALSPYQPQIDEATAQLSQRFSGVRQLADQVAREVGKETKQLEPALGVIKSVGPRKLFNLENVAVLPFWLAIIFAKDNGLVKALVSSYLPIVVAALAYVWAAYLALQDPVALSGFSGSFDLATLTKGFSSETAVACAWAHFIAQDLFVGRWIYLDSLRNGVWSAHSLLLAFFFGPAGVLSHLLTRGVVRVFRWDVEDIMSAGTRDVAPSAADGVARQMISDAEKQAKAQLKAADKEADKVLAKAKSEARRLVQDARAEAEAALSQEKELKRRAEADARAILEKAQKEADKLLAAASAKASTVAAAAAAAAPGPAPQPAKAAGGGSAEDLF